jgi:hypothetical protein
MGWANFDSRVKIVNNFVEDLYVIPCTKYQRSGPRTLKQDMFLHICIYKTRFSGPIT